MYIHIMSLSYINNIPISATDSLSWNFFYSDKILQILLRKCDEDLNLTYLTF